MTKEEAIRNLQFVRNNLNDSTKIAKAYDMAIKALEQEPILDKIRAKISNIPLTDTDGNNGHWYREPQAIIDDVFQIIDKYKEESEANNG